MRVIIYGLSSTEDGKIRYVGQTKQLLSARFNKHRLAARFKAHGSKTYCAKWIRSVWARGHDVFCFPIETDAVLHETERRLIAWYRQHGARLVNTTDGGEGIHGYKWTPQQIENIARVRKGRVISPEWRAAISAGSRGKAKPIGHGANVSAARKGMKFTDEHRANIGRASKGRRLPPLPEEARRKIGEAKRLWWARKRDANG